MEEIKVDQKIKLTAKDFASGQDVRWCPGCGDYSILAQVQRSFPEIVGLIKIKLYGFPVSDVLPVFLIIWKLTASIPFMVERRQLQPE